MFCTRGVNGGVEIDKNYKFDKSFFSTSDIHEIIFALKIMDSFSNKEKRNSIINKLCLISPELSTMFENDAKQYLSIDLLNEKITTDDWIFEKIDYCLDNEVFAIINKKNTVASISYVLKTDGLYLFCYEKNYKLIKCKDIRSIDITNTTFERNFITYEEYKKIN